jgi:hypothetical protein
MSTGRRVYFTILGQALQERLGPVLGDALGQAGLEDLLGAHSLLGIGLLAQLGDQLLDDADLLPLAVAGGRGDDVEVELVPLAGDAAELVLDDAHGALGVVGGDHRR